MYKDVKMNDSDKPAFKQRIKDMIMLTSGADSPSAGVYRGYYNALKEFSMEDITSAIDDLLSDPGEHISPAMIRNKIAPAVEKLSDDNMRRRAHEELSKEHWERMGYQSVEAYEKANHAKWVRDQSK